MKALKQTSLFLIMLSVLLIWGCGSVRKVPVPADVQVQVQEKIMDRKYMIRYFHPPYTLEVSKDQKRYRYESGIIQVNNDVLVHEEYFSGYNVSYRIIDYKETRTPLGETVITFFAERYKKEHGKVILVSVAYRFKIYSLEKIDVSIDKYTYTGEFEKHENY